MTKLLTSLLLCLIGTVSVVPQAGFSKYVNEKYKFSIEYPGNLIEMTRLPKEGDIGMDFVSKDEKVKMMVLGSENESSLNLRELAHIYVYRHLLQADDLEQKEVSPFEFTLSGTIKKQFRFLKVVRHKSPKADIYYTLFIRYPKSARKDWEPIAKRIAESFRFDPDANADL